MRREVLLGTLLRTVAGLCGDGPDRTMVELRAQPPTTKQITPLHFGVNAELFRPGLYYGTLPTSHPKSRHERKALRLSQGANRRGQ